MSKSILCAAHSRTQKFKKSIVHLKKTDQKSRIEYACSSLYSHYQNHSQTLPVDVYVDEVLDDMIEAKQSFNAWKRLKRKISNELEKNEHSCS